MTPFCLSASCCLDDPSLLACSMTSQMQTWLDGTLKISLYIKHGRTDAMPYAFSVLIIEKINVTD